MLLDLRGGEGNTYAAADSSAIPIRLELMFLAVNIYSAATFPTRVVQFASAECRIQGGASFDVCLSRFLDEMLARGFSSEKRLWERSFTAKVAGGSEGRQS